ncbi:MAG: PilW family protein [Planctomycetota bacterium]|jgi:hypothetical protein
MLKKRTENPKGFSSIELMIAITIGCIVMLGVGMAIADSHRGYNAMYDRMYSDVVTEGYIARKMFDSVIRRATRTRFLLDSGGNWIEVYHCQDPNSTIVDSYARFFTANGDLNIEYGTLNPRQTLSTNTVCVNVAGCVFFRGAGRSAQMVLTLDNGSESITVVSSAVMQNQ